MPYCTQADVENLLSAIGVALRINDMPAAAVAEALNRADDTLNESLWERYGVNLEGSDWVKRKAAVAAAYYVCKFKGNTAPIGIATLFKELTEQTLPKVQSGASNIPKILPVKPTGNVPTMSNHSVYNRPYPHVTVEKSKSTGVPENYPQDVNPFDVGQGSQGGA